MKALPDRALLPWDRLPDRMKNDEVRPYWNALARRRGQLRLKRAFDVTISLIMIALLLVPMLVIAAAVRLDSPGPALYRQIRVTRYGRKFRINKFRTMYDDKDLRRRQSRTQNSSVTVSGDSRVTPVGAFLRRYRLDEFPQLFNVLTGDMTFVGTRPEVPEYVDCYRPEWMATLLLPAGITSECSIRYRDEEKLLKDVPPDRIDDTYVNRILPDKMKINLAAVRDFSLTADIRTMIRTASAVLH